MDFGFQKRFIAFVFAAGLPVNPAFADNFIYTTLNVPDANTLGLGVVATGINNHGVIVGNYLDQSGYAGYKGFLFDGSQYTSIVNPNATVRTEVQGINDNGDIVGDYFGNNGTYSFIGNNGVYTDFEVPNGFNGTFAYDVNNMGVVAGYYFDYHDANAYGFTYNNGALTTISAPNAILTYVRGINDNGDLAGSYFDKSSGMSIGFVERNGVFTDISHPDSPTLTFITGLNNRGEAVGSYVTGDASNRVIHGFLYEGGNFITIDNPNAVFSQNGLSSHTGGTWLSGINDLGQVTGSYTTLNADGTGYTQNAFYVNTAPVPLPAAVWLFGSALLGLTRFSRRG